jgi:hypothetical protein
MNNSISIVFLLLLVLLTMVSSFAAVDTFEGEIEAPVDDYVEDPPSRRLRGYSDDHFDHFDRRRRHSPWWRRRRNYWRRKHWRRDFEDEHFEPEHFKRGGGFKDFEDEGFGGRGEGFGGRGGGFGGGRRGGF